INRQWLWNRGDASKESERTEVIQLPDNGSCSILIGCVLTLQILRHRNELGQITNPQPIHRDILLLIMFRLRGYLCGKLSNRKNFGICCCILKSNPTKTEPFNSLLKDEPLL